MSLEHSTELRNEHAANVLAKVDGGASFGTIAILDSEDIVLAEITLQKPSSGRVEAVLTYIGLPLSVIAIATGIPVRAEVRDSDGLAHYAGTCGVATGVPTTEPDFTIDQVPIQSGQLVSLVTHSYESMD